MKSFSDSFVAALNARVGAGVFFKSAIVSVTDSDTRYFADVQQPLMIDGHAYTPMPMSWQGFQQRSDMPILGVQVTVPNITGEVGAFLETTSLKGRRVVLSIMHMDLLGVANAHLTVTMQILFTRWNYSAQQPTATFVCTMGLLLNEQLPGKIITRASFPGTPDLQRRASIL